MSGPVPSHLVLLSDLGRCAPGMKVRFLGWYSSPCQGYRHVLISNSVDEYVAKTATLRLKHNYPTFTSHIVANVNVDHVLEQVKRQELDVGTWLNVMGYVEQRKEKGVFIQAVTIWDADNVDLEAYEKSVEKRKQSG